MEEWEQDRRRRAVSPGRLCSGAGSSEGRDEGMEMGQPEQGEQRADGAGAVPAAGMGQGGGASPALAPAGLLGRGGEGITRLGKMR